MGERVFYAITSRSLQEDDRRLLAQVRRTYFEENGAWQQGRVDSDTFGMDDTARYRMTRHSMKWELTAGGQVLQRAVPTENGGYAILTRDEAGDLREKADFDRDHRWVRSSFFHGNPKRPELMLEPEKGDTMLCLRYDDRLHKYRRSYLVACLAEQTDSDRVQMDSEAGAPDILADTSDGMLYYCTPEERNARQAAADKHGESGPSEWNAAPEAPIDFQFIRNEHVLDETTAPQLDLEVESEDGPLLLEMADAAPPALEDCIIDTQVPDEPAVIEEDVVPVPVVFRPPAQPEPAPAAPEPELADSLRPARRIVVSNKEIYLYFGPLRDGRRQGQGRTQMQNGHTAYEGGFSGDKREGFGTYYYKSGHLCYAGNWHQNQRSGLGVSFSARDGSLFVGSWENNTPTGRGAAFNRDGSLSYYGMWLDGLRDGRGIEYYGGSVLYEGQWRQDCYNGHGCLHLSGGGTLTGTFRDGFANGPCEEHAADGKTVRTGVWQNGHFVSGVSYRDGKPAEIVIREDDV
ncbi:hypothetical protein B6259_09090 [Ruminococcaceae bacterium CPB6]|nr:hypothetical protein B6259_09090 [Ruminococcaceae bacterium CPB6]